MPHAAWWYRMAALCALGTQAKVLINEIHYDNVGADVDEFVEVAMLESEFANARNILFHEVEGASGLTFGNLDVTKNVGTDSFTCRPNGAGLVFCVLVYAGIENGRTGFALVRTNGEVLDAVAVGVPGTGNDTSPAIRGAAGTTLANTVFREIGQENGNVVPTGQSLQLTDAGFRVQPSTPAQLNTGQSSSIIGIVPTASPTTAQPTTAKPTTAKPTTAKPTTAKPTTAKPTTAKPTTGKPTTAAPTSAAPTTAAPTTAAPTTAAPTTAAPTTAVPTTALTAAPTTEAPTTAAPTNTPTTPAPTQLLTQTPTTALITRAPTSPVQAAPGGAAGGGAAPAAGGPDIAVVIAGVLGGSVIVSVGVAMMSAKKNGEYAVGTANARYGGYP